jgi:hypothetical protein
MQLLTSQAQLPLSSRTHRPVSPPKVPSGQIVYGLPRTGAHSELAQAPPLELSPSPPELSPSPPELSPPPLELLPAECPAPASLVLVPQATKPLARARMASVKI